MLWNYHFFSARFCFLLLSMHICIAYIFPSHMLGHKLTNRTAYLTNLCVGFILSRVFFRNSSFPSDLVRSPVLTIISLNDIKQLQHGPRTYHRRCTEWQRLCLFCGFSPRYSTHGKIFVKFN